METTFDFLGYFDKLKQAGVPEEQAKVQAEASRETIQNNLATKRDLRESEYRLIIKLGGITVACSALIVSILSFLIK